MVFMVYFEYNSGYLLFYSVVGIIQMILFTIKIIFHTFDVIFIFKDLKLYGYYKDHPIRYKVIKSAFSSCKLVYKISYSYQNLYQPSTFWSLILSASWITMRIGQTIINNAVYEKRAKQLSILRENAIMICIVPMIIIMTTILYALVTMDNVATLYIVAAVIFIFTGCCLYSVAKWKQYDGDNCMCYMLMCSMCGLFWTIFTMGIMVLIDDNEVYNPYFYLQRNISYVGFAMTILFLLVFSMCVCLGS